MILLLGGTLDGRLAAVALAEKGRDVIYSSVSGYNAPKETEHLTCRAGALEENALEALIREQGISMLVDATHPYAKAASTGAMTAAKNTGVRYVRLERPGIEGLGVPTDAVIHFESYEGVVDYLKYHPGNILTTTGSRELVRYEALDKARIFVRVLPTSKVIAECEALGYKPSRIIAMQGPFSREMNVAMMHDFDIKYLTTKDSGDIGGVAEKISAAAECGVKVLCVDRPNLAYPEVCRTPEELVKLL